MADTVKVEANHPRIMDGLLTRAQLEAETGWGWRTVLRREAEGLPVIVIGGRKLYPREKIRMWILSQERVHQAPKRGRPRKSTWGKAA
jgi:hypothetical protein